MGFVLGGRYCYFHVIKTGGESFTRFAEDNRLQLRPHPEVPYHAGLHDLSDDLRREMATRWLVATIRNPWDWYVSVYHYFHKRDQSPMRFIEPFSTGDFNGTMARILSPAENGLTNQTPVFVHDRQENIFPISKMREYDIGLYSWFLIEHLFAGRYEEALSNPVDTCATNLVDTSRMVEGFSKFFEHIDQPLTDRQRESLALMRRLNRTQGGPAHLQLPPAAGDHLFHQESYSSFYDPELTETVRHKERLAISLMDYTGPGEAAPEPLLFTGRRNNYYQAIPWLSDDPARVPPLHLDLGCGDGHYLAQMAAQDQDGLWLGIDIMENRLQQAEQRTVHLNNARVLRYDIAMLDDIISPGSVDSIHLMMPNRWEASFSGQGVHPADTIAKMLSRLLKKGGEMRCKTNFRDIAFDLQRCAVLQELRVVSAVDDIENGAPWPDDAETTFQTQYLWQRKTVYTLWLRKP